MPRISVKDMKKPAKKKVAKKKTTRRGRKPDAVDAAEASARHSVDQLRRESTADAAGDHRVTIEMNGRVIADATGADFQSLNDAAMKQAAPSIAEAFRANAAPATPNREPMVRVHVPTKIGACTADEDGRFSVQDVAVLDVNIERAMLAATNGRILALVEVDVERINKPAERGLAPTWLPKPFAKPESDGPRELRLVKGERTSLYGVGNTWVDDAEGRFREQIESGKFPPIATILPSLLEGRTACVTINAEQLLRLANALSDGEQAPGITLFIPYAEGKAVDTMIAAVGNKGIGVILPAKPEGGYHGRREAYSVLRGHAIAAAEGASNVGTAEDAKAAGADQRSVFSPDAGTEFTDD